MSSATSQPPAIRCTEEGCGKKFSRQADLERHLRELHGPKIMCEYPGCPWPGAKRLQRYHAHLKDKHGVTPEFELIIPEGFLESSGAMEYVPTPQQASDNSLFLDGYPQAYFQGYAPVSTSFNQTQATSNPPPLSSSSTTPSNSAYQGSPQNTTQYSPPYQNHENADTPMSLYGNQGGLNGTQLDFQLYGSSTTPPSYNFHNGGYTGGS